MNIKDTGVDLFVESSEATGVYAVYGKDVLRLSNSAYPDGQDRASLTPSRYHVIHFANLTPETTYTYSLLSDAGVLQESGQQTFEFTTLSTSQRNIKTTPIYGKVVAPDGTGLRDAIVVATITSPSGQESYATTTKSTGEWLMPISAGGESHQPVQIMVYHDMYPPSTIATVFEKAAPVPQSTVIGTNYTFTSETLNVLPASTRREQDTTYTISLLYPEKDAVVPNDRPLFKGFGIPGTRVTISVSSRPVFEAQTAINQKGAWVIEASRPFAPGPYTITVQVVDNLGQVRTISRTFTIAKSGEQVLGEAVNATPSGTLTPTRTTTPAQSPTQPPLVTATPMPTSIVYITATPDPAYGVTATPARLQDAGGEVPLSWIVMGSILLSMGIFLVRAQSVWETR